MDEAIQIQVDFKRLVQFEGELDIPVEIFNKGQEAVNDFAIDNHERLMETDFSELEYAGAQCSGCDTEFKHRDEIKWMKKVTSYQEKFCEKCNEDM